MLRTSIFMGLCFYKMIRLCQTLYSKFEYVYLITQKFHSITLHLSLSLQKNLIVVAVLKVWVLSILVAAL